MAQRDIFLVIGQSNTSGRGVVEMEDTVALSGVDLFNGANWEPAVNIIGGNGGLNRYSTILNSNQNQGLNYTYTFGRTVNEVTGNQIGLVVNARGGTNLNAWAKGATEDYYGAALIQINAALALQGSTLKGILWHQGESNRNDSNYLTKIKTFVTNLRSDLNMPNLPFILGELSKQRTDNDTFNANLRKLSDPTDAAYIANTSFASSEGLITTDRTHFISNSQRVLGYRYGAEVLEMIYGYNYIRDQIVYVTEDAYVRSGVHADIVQQTGSENELMRITKTSNNVNDNRTGLFKFNINNITGTTDRLIIDTTLFINADLQDDDGTDNNEPMSVNFYDVDTSWSEDTVTFNNGPVFSNLISSSFSSFFIDGLHQRGADIAEYIRDGYAQGASTIALGLQAETINTQLTISTKDDAANFLLRPHLRISYIDTSSNTLSNIIFEENELDNKVVFKNPVKNELALNTDFNITEVNIYSIRGQLLKVQKVNNTFVNLRVSDLFAGTYILVVKNNDKDVVKLFIKN